MTYQIDIQFRNFYWRYFHWPRHVWCGKLYWFVNTFNCYWSEQPRVSAKFCITRSRYMLNICIVSIYICIINFTREINMVFIIIISSDRLDIGLSQRLSNRSTLRHPHPSRPCDLNQVLAQIFHLNKKLLRLHHLPLPEICQLDPVVLSWTHADLKLRTYH